MTKRNRILASLIVLMVAGGGVHAAEKNIAGSMRQGEGDPVAGKDKAAMCAGCHGEDGMSIDPTTFPNLAGQYAGYIYKQVRDFQLENRNDPTMSSMAGMVTETQDLKDIAAYFSSLKVMKGAPGDAKLAAKGKTLFYKGNKKLGEFAACVRCHGEKGKGKDKNNALFPVIGGQTKDYLIKQLNDFKSGTRSNDPASMMAMVAQGLSEKEIKEVAEYLSGL